MTALVLATGLTVICNNLAKQLDHQMMAERWSSDGGVSQVSCFFATDAQMTEGQIQSFEHSLDSALVGASIEVEEGSSARLWVDAYSADGRITLSTERGTLDTEALGVGGDFFLFHPLKLICGSYFSGNDLMQDHVVIDEDAAWQLFGSTDVAGQIVMVGNVPHIVSGVVERPQGRLEEAAGLDATVVYVSYQTLQELGRSYGLNHYEIVMPNPVSGFAVKQVQENIGVDEKEMEVVENTSRFSLLSRFKLIRQFPTRSMNGKAIIYPYWENLARGYEDIIAVYTVLSLIFFAYAGIGILICLIKWWKNRRFTAKDIWNMGKDRTERFIEYKRLQRQRQALAQDEEEKL